MEISKEDIGTGNCQIISLVHNFGPVFFSISFLIFNHSSLETDLLIGNTKNDQEVGLKEADRREYESDMSIVDETPFKKTKADLNFKNRNEWEEETKIWRIIMLEVSYLKRIILVPLLCVLTAFFILLWWFWSISLKRFLFFNIWNDLDKASHLYVYGKRKQREIVKLNKGSHFHQTWHLLLPTSQRVYLTSLVFIPKNNLFLN